MDTYDLPLHLTYEDKALYHRFTLRQSALLGAGAVAALTLVTSTSSRLPLPVQLGLAGLVLLLATLQALVRRHGRSPLGWLLLWLRFRATPAAAVWRPATPPAPAGDPLDGFVAVEPGVLCPAWAEREGRA